MATYTTDLTDIEDFDSLTTATEFTSWNNGAAPDEDDTDYFIQGTACCTAALSKSTGLQSICFDYGSDLGGSFSSGDCVFMWQVILAGNAIESWDNGGYRLGIGSSTSAYWGWITGGVDFGRNPYGGWQNVAVVPDMQNTAVQIDVNSTSGTFTRSTGSFITDGFEIGHPVYGQNFANAGNNARFFISTITATVITVTDSTGMVTETGSGDEVLYMCDYIYGTPTTHEYFGSGANLASEIAKGNLHGLDCMRYGRGEIKATGTSATFAGMAQENDYNDVTNGYNRWGLFQEQAGGYLWKGLMSLGDASTTVTFSDSDRNIFIDDCPRAYADFNKIEINNASSSVTWTRITFAALTDDNFTRGNFEMVANATVDINSCSFIDMGTFTFDSNATVDDSTFLRCDQITHGGADFNNCTFNGYEGASDTAYLVYNENTNIDGEADGCSFTKGTASTHAIELGASAATTQTFRDMTFSGYNGTNGNTDSTILLADQGSNKTWTLSFVGCSGNQTYKKTRSGDLVITIFDPVTLTVTVKKNSDKTAISGARVLVWVTDNANYFYQASVTITSSGTTATVSHTAHGLSNNDNVIIQGANEPEYNGAWQITTSGANAYTYTMQSSADSPATGTILSTFAPINATTDGSGQASDARTYSADQPVAGRVRYSSDPYYKQGDINTTVDSADGKDVELFLVSDE